MAHSVTGQSVEFRNEKSRKWEALLKMAQLIFMTWANTSIGVKCPSSETRRKGIYQWQIISSLRTASIRGAVFTKSPQADHIDSKSSSRIKLRKEKNLPIKPWWKCSLIIEISFYQRPFLICSTHLIPFVTFGKTKKPIDILSCFENGTTLCLRHRSKQPCIMCSSMSFTNHCCRALL